MVEADLERAEERAESGEGYVFKYGYAVKKKNMCLINKKIKFVIRCVVCFLPFLTKLSFFLF